MFYCRRASPKRCNNTTEVEYGGGGHRTRLRHDLKDQLVCLEVPPAPVYKGSRGRGRPARRRRAGRSPTPTGSRTPSLFLVGLGVEGGKEEGEKERGAPPPPPPCPIRTRGGGGARPALAAPPLLHFRPMRPINPPGGSGNPPVLRFYLISSRNPSDVRI